MPTIQEIIKTFKKFHPKDNPEIIEKAYQFAKKAHQGQKRLSGEDYISHCLHTAKTIAQLRLDAQTIAAALLHDVLDDTKITTQEFKKEFGQEVAKLVQGVSKIGKIKYRGLERAVENFRKLFLAMAEDIRVILIKLADRLHNMQTLSVLPQEKQKRIAQETLEIYAPLAYRLGIGELKGQLEDLAFPYVYPKEYNWLMEGLQEKYQTREKYLNKIKPLLEKELTQEKIKVLEIHSRAKHHYSLYKKLLKYDMNWDKIYDLVALRIIVPDLESCYAVLGAIHRKWKPLIGRIKDYIALPKPNGYQSLHTTVFCEGGKITEFQIRTPQMHEEAEYGIAAHWYYEEQKGLKSYIKKRILGKTPEKELTWVRQLRDWQKEKFDSPEEFLESLKIDFFRDRIFVFTPKGDIIDLPEGATPIDFAYQIHTDIGHQCAGAKIDGKLSPLNQPLKNGQVVEIVVQKNKKPSRDWLEFVKTSQAKSKIRAWFVRQNSA
jgi:GTP pyrophosphokinase